MKFIQRSFEVPVGKCRQWQEAGRTINPSRFNNFVDEKELDDLSASIKRMGQLEPGLIVLGEEYKYPDPMPQTAEGLAAWAASNDVFFDVVVGNNRWKACQMAGVPTFFCQVATGTKGELLTIALEDHLKRNNPSPMDIARALRLVQIHSNMTNRQMAIKFGLSPTEVGNYLLLLSLPPTFQNYLHDSQQKRGLWGKDTDGEKMSRLGMSKALALYREARQYAEGVCGENDEEGIENYTNQALGRVLMIFENGDQKSTPRVPKGTWFSPAIWPEGSRPKDTPNPTVDTTTTIDPVDADVPPAKDPEANIPPTIDPDKEPSAASAGAGKSDKKIKGEKFGVGMTCAYIIGAKRRLISDFHIPAKSEVALTLDAVNVFLAHLEKMEVGSDEANRAEGEFLMAVKRQAERVEKVCEDLRKAEQTIIELEKLASVPA